MSNPDDRIISPLELMEEMHDREVPPQVIDVRPPEAYNAGHIPEAVNIPGDLIVESLQQVDMSRPVVVYCNMHHPDESSSEKAAKQLRALGIQVRVLQGGLPAWELAGFPLDKGERFQQYGKA
jgi:ArsR family transcriptional regulator